MGTIYFRMRSELKWREVQSPVTFIAVSDLRTLVEQALGLNGTDETVELSDDVTLLPFSESKQIVRGQKVIAVRTTRAQLEVRRQGRDDARDGLASAEAGTGASDDMHKQVALDRLEDDEFGPDLLDFDAQRAYASRARALEDAAKERERPIGKLQEVLAGQGNGQVIEQGSTPPLQRKPSSRAAGDSDDERIDDAALDALLRAHSAQVAAARGDNDLAPVPNNGDLLLHRCTSMEDPTGPDHNASSSLAIVPVGKPADEQGSDGSASSSVLAQHPDLHWKCKSFLPRGPAEHLYELFGVPRAMKRAQWDAWKAGHAREASALSTSRSASPVASDSSPRGSPRSGTERALRGPLATPAASRARSRATHATREVAPRSPHSTHARGDISPARRRRERSRSRRDEEPRRARERPRERSRSRREEEPRRARERSRRRAGSASRDGRREEGRSARRRGHSQQRASVPHSASDGSSPATPRRRASRARAQDEALDARPHGGGPTAASPERWRPGDDVATEGPAVAERLHAYSRSPSPEHREHGPSEVPHLGSQAGSGAEVWEEVAAARAAGRLEPDALPVQQDEAATLHGDEGPGDSPRGQPHKDRFGDARAAVDLRRVVPRRKSLSERRGTRPPRPSSLFASAVQDILRR